MSNSDGTDEPIAQEIRTRRIVVVDDGGNDRAVVQVVRDHVELRLISSDGTNNCEVLAFSGLQARETLAAGIELWVNGDSVGSWTAVLSGGETELHRFP